MNNTMIKRIALLVMSFVIASFGMASAHSLPGSVLMLWQEDAHLHLTVRLPLTELIVASNEFEDFDNLPVGPNFSGQYSERIATYFAQHLHLRQNTADLSLTFSRAALETGENPHVGKHKLLVAYFTVKETTKEPLMLHLTYDGVMHEVRSHRAAVYWGKPDSNAKRIADFGFYQVNGMPKAISLKTP